MKGVWYHHQVGITNYPRFLGFEEDKVEEQMTNYVCLECKAEIGETMNTNFKTLYGFCCEECKRKYEEKYEIKGSDKEVYPTGLNGPSEISGS